MLISLPSILKVSKRHGLQDCTCLAPTHESMQLEHEKRKGLELRRRLAHEKHYHNVHGI